MVYENMTASFTGVTYLEQDHYEVANMMLNIIFFFLGLIPLSGILVFLQLKKKILTEEEELE